MKRAKGGKGTLKYGEENQGIKDSQRGKDLRAALEQENGLRVLRRRIRDKRSALNEFLSLLSFLRIRKKSVVALHELLHLRIRQRQSPNDSLWIFYTVPGSLPLPVRKTFLENCHRRIGVLYKSEMNFFLID